MSKKKDLGIAALCVVISAVVVLAVSAATAGTAAKKAQAELDTALAFLLP